MKLVCISDTHNNKVKIPTCDCLIHAGDLTGRGERHEVEKQLEWLSVQEASRIIFVPVNHDFMFERHPDEARELCDRHRIELLIDQCTVLGGLNVWGTPYQPWFFDWAFNIQDDEELQAKWDMIPDDTDILITHCPPLNILDGLPNGNRIGSQSLFKRLFSLEPMLQVFGHCHNGYGTTTMDLATGKNSGLRTVFVNAAACNERYQAVNQPIVIHM